MARYFEKCSVAPERRKLRSRFSFTSALVRNRRRIVNLMQSGASGRDGRKSASRAQRRLDALLERPPISMRCACSNAWH